MKGSAEQPLVGLLLVSHSAALARGVAELAGQMAGAGVRIQAIGGAPDGALGSDAERVLAALQDAASSGAVVVLMDLGSAVLAARAALEELTPRDRSRVRLVDAPFVEGAVVAAATAGAGATLDEVAEAAREARLLEKL